MTKSTSISLSDELSNRIDRYDDDHPYSKLNKSKIASESIDKVLTELGY